MVALALGLVTIGSQTTRAQEARDLDLERFRPSPDRHGFLGIGGSSVPGEWGYNALFAVGYQSDPLTVQRTADGDTTSVIGHRISGDLILQLGIAEFLSVWIDAPVVFWQETDGNALDGGSAIATTALRDLYYAVKLRVLGDFPRDPGHETDRSGPGLALQLASTVPWGLEESFAGEGRPQIEASVIGDLHLLNFGVGAVIGYRHRFAGPRVLSVRFENEFFFGVGVQIPTILIPNLSGLLEVRVTTATDIEAFAEASTVVEGNLGARWADGDWALTWMVGPGFPPGGVGTPGFRGQFAVEFAPRRHDRDGDGFVDSQDGCEFLPEDMDDFEDEDGCPDVDNDGDLIADEDDLCPNEAAESERDADEDGCTDPIEDADEDGLADEEDACPNRAEDADGFEDDDGCPDEDNDGDQVLDADDRCASEGEDRDGFEDNDGCPDPDNDSDGIGDADDLCPDEAEDADDFEPDDGCPEPDNDQDGVLDADDECPSEDETINGVNDEDGCPDRGGRVRWRVSTSGALRGRVEFRAEGELAPRSTGSVAQLARWLIAAGREPRLVAIGSERSADRQVLRSRLIDLGVSPDRFQVVTDSRLRGSVTELRRPPSSDDADHPPIESSSSTRPERPL